MSAEVSNFLDIYLYLTFTRSWHTLLILFRFDFHLGHFLWFFAHSIYYFKWTFIHIDFIFILFFLPTFLFGNDKIIWPSTVFIMNISILSQESS